MSDVEIVLTKPLIGPNGTIGKVIIREPTAADYFKLGDPHSFAQAADGLILSAEREEVVQAYMKRCVIEPANSMLLEQMVLADAIRVKEAILNFFTAARSTKSQSDATSSSST